MAWRFGLISLLLVLLVPGAFLFIVGSHLSSTLEADAMEESTRYGRWQAAMVAKAMPPEWLAAPGNNASNDDIDRFVTGHIMRPGIELVKLWTADSVVAYSNKRQLAGLAFPKNDRLAAALRGQSVTFRFRPSNRPDLAGFGFPDHTMVSVYSPIYAGDPPRVIGGSHPYSG